MISIPSDTVADALVDALVDTESSFKRIWLSTASKTSLLNRAFYSGFLSDRLSWVFIAAYQAAHRQVFEGLAADEWWAFAGSEDKSGKLPGVSVTDGKLNGTKTWVAAIEHVDRIIVSVGRTFFVVQPRDSSIELQTYPPGKFLPDMSVGRMTMTNTRAAETIVMNGDFALAEPVYITAAGFGYLLKESRRLSRADLEEDIRQSCEKLSDLWSRGYTEDIKALLGIYREIGRVGKILADDATMLNDRQARDWQESGKLLGMYRKGIEQRLA